MGKNRLRGIIVTVIILLIIALGIGAYIIVNREEPIPADAIGNTSGNLNNRGLFCESDGYIYFSNSYDQRKLYKMKADGSELECIADVPVEFINVYGDKVFFYQTPGADNQVFGLGGLYGICSTDTKGKSGMNNIDKTVCNSLLLYGPNLYYQRYEDGELYLYKADPKTKERILLSNRRVFASTPFNGKLMTYNEDIGYYLSLFNLDSGQFELYDQNVRAYNVIVEGSYIYYMDIDDSYRIYRMYIPTYETERLTDDIVDRFNVYGDNIFYQKNSETEPALKHMKTDGSNPSVIAEGNYTNINCTSEYTYFYTFGDSAAIYRVPTNGGQAQTFVP